MLTKTLVIGLLPKNYNSESHVVLGPWSYAKNQELIFDGLASFEPDPKNLNRLSLKSSQFAEKMLDRLVPYLNEKNNTSYTKIFWRIMSMSWLSTLVQITMERFVRIDNLFKNHPNTIFKTELIPIESLNHFRTTEDFFSNGVFSIYFNHWLMSRIIEQYNNNNIIIEWSEEENKNYNKFDNKKIKTSIYNFFYEFFPTSTIPGMNIFESLLWDLSLKYKKVINTKKTDSKNTLDDNIDEINNFVNWGLLIDKTIPKELLKIPKNLKIPKPAVKIIGPKLLYQAKCKLKQKIAMHGESGSVLISTQHGSRYGTLENVPYIDSVEYKMDYFITWGWDEQSPYKVNCIPLPSPFLLKRTNKKIKNPLFIGQHTPLFNYRLDSAPSPGDCSKILHQFNLLIKALNQDIRSKLLLRFYPTNKNDLYNHASIDYKSYWERKFNNLIVGKKAAPNKKIIFSSKLMIIDHPGTALHRRLAANLPMIGYWNRKMWKVSIEARPHFDSLYENQILYDDSISAAKKINEIWPNINDWWHEAPRQEAVHKWSHNYARSSKKWRKEWISKISSLPF